MNETSYDRFIALAELDKQSIDFQHEAEQLHKEQEQINLQIQLITQELEAAHLAERELKKSIDVAELEIKALDEKIRDKKMRLDNAATPKEFFSLEHELDALKKQREGLENQLFEVWQKYDVAHKNYESHKEASPTKLQTLQVQLAPTKERTTYLASRVDELSRAREQYTHDIDPELLKQYDSMKERVSNPVVPVIKNSCTGCFQTVTAQDLNDIALKKIVKCRNCYRILYLHR